jgi:hypothetical protein
LFYWVGGTNKLQGDKIMEVTQDQEKCKHEVPFDEHCSLCYGDFLKHTDYHIATAMDYERFRREVNPKKTAT